MSNVMTIATLWGERRGFEGEIPELMVAWDEYSVEHNYEGYEAVKALARAQWDGDLVREREIIFEVSYDAVMAAFASPVIRAHIVNEEKQA